MDLPRYAELVDEHTECRGPECLLHPHADRAVLCERMEGSRGLIWSRRSDETCSAIGDAPYVSIRSILPPSVLS
jgi:hypothetical protein